MKLIVVVSTKTHENDKDKKPMVIVAKDGMLAEVIKQLMPMRLDGRFKVFELEGDEVCVASDENEIIKMLNEEY